MKIKPTTMILTMLAGWINHRQQEIIEERLNSIEVTHAGKIISDICILGFFSAGELLIACKQNPGVITDIHNRHINLFNDIFQTGKDWQGIECGKPIQ